MLSCIIIVIILVLLVLLGLWFWGYFGSGDDKSPISKDGKRIDELDLESAVKSLKEHGFKQSDKVLRDMLAISYIYAGMKKEDLQEISKSLSKTGSKNTIAKDGVSTEEGKSDDDKPKPTSKDSNEKSVDKLENFNKGFRTDVFSKDGVKKTLSGESNKKAKELLLSFKDVDPEKPSKPKIPGYEKIIKKQNVSRIDKEDKTLEPLAKGVFAKFVDMYEKIVTSSSCQ